MSNRPLRNSAIAVLVLASAGHAHADAVVSDGRFTNVYVYPDPDRETWEQHLNGLPRIQKPSDPDNFTRKSIDAFTQSLMNTEWPSRQSLLGPVWPSYFRRIASIWRHQSAALFRQLCRLPGMRGCGDDGPE